MKKLTTIDLLVLPSLETPPTGYIGFGAKSDGLYQKIGTVETKLSVDGHTHTIAQITGLQGALDSKATPSDISTAVNNLEIGGRNLIVLQNVVTKNGRLSAVTNTTNYIYSDAGFYTTDKIYVNEGDEVVLTSHRIISGYLALGYFDEDDIFFSRPIMVTNFEANSYVLTIPSRVAYIRVSFLGSDSNYIKLEKGNKATDWTPTPEDQVSDWSVTDVNSFAFIKNKPTQLSQFIDNIGVATHIANTSNPHNVTTAQIGAVDLTTNQSIGGNKTFTGNVVIKGAAANSPLKVRGIDGYIDSTGSLDNLYLNFVSAKDVVMVMGGGNVGIGTTSPSQKLHVAGNIIATGEVTAYVASDRRLKENITPITSALDYINRLNPVTYNWNARAKELNSNKPNDLDYGLIAQEVESVLPNIVHGIFDDKYKSIDYIKLIPIMIGAIKELKQEINRLKN